MVIVIYKVVFLFRNTVLWIENQRQKIING